VSAGVEPGQRVRITAAALGTVTRAEPHGFTEHIATEGETGIVSRDFTHDLEGWLYVKLDNDRGTGAPLFVPVNLYMIEPVGATGEATTASDGGDNNGNE
jgi:hypothetical protein